MRKDIWIRKEDLAKWEAIEDKPLFIHNAINGISHVEGSRMRETKKDESNVMPGANLLCKHGYSPSMCRFAKNGKPCPARK